MNDTDLLISIAQKHTQLRLVSGKYLGLCPIHGEKTPSFWIYPEQGKYRCYGCNAAGDAIDLHQALTGVDYIQAKKDLGLWDDSRPEPKPRPKQPPRDFTSDNRAECYRIARASLVRMRDCKITHHGTTTKNHKFVLSAISGHTDRDGFISRICSDIAGHNWQHQSQGSINIFVELFLNECYDRSER